MCKDLYTWCKSRDPKLTKQQQEVITLTVNETKNNNHVWGNMLQNVVFFSILLSVDFFVTCLNYLPWKQWLHCTSTMYGFKKNIQYSFFFVLQWFNLQPYNLISSRKLSLCFEGCNILAYFPLKLQGNKWLKALTRHFIVMHTYYAENA